MIADDEISRAVAAVRSGGIIAYPTEAVYGLGCDPRDEAAVMRLLALKEREVSAGLILIAADMRQLEEFMLPLDDAIRDRVTATWPGPVTWVVPASPNAGRWITGGRPTVAVRVTAHPGAAALCEAAGTALVSTSANLHGSAPARSKRDVEIAFGQLVDVVLGGECGEQDRPTEIRDAVSGAVLRSG